MTGVETALTWDDEIDADRIVVWPDLRRAGSPRVIGEPLPGGDPDPQRPPKGGTAPRACGRRARRGAGS